MMAVSIDSFKRRVLVLSLSSVNFLSRSFNSFACASSSAVFFSVSVPSSFARSSLSSLLLPGSSVAGSSSPTGLQLLDACIELCNGRELSVSWVFAVAMDASRMLFCFSFSISSSLTFSSVSSSLTFHLPFLVASSATGRSRSL